MFDLGAVYRKNVGLSPLKALKGRTFPDFKAHHNEVIVVSRLRDGIDVMRKSKYVISEMSPVSDRRWLLFTDVFSPDGGKRASVLCKLRSLMRQEKAVDRLPCGLPHSSLSMADQPSSTAKKSKKKGGRNLIKPFLDWITPRSANASASPSNSNRVFVSSAHEPVSGNGAGSADLKVSSTYIG